MEGDTDMTEVLEQFAVAGPDAIFFPLFITEGSAFAAQARAFDGLEGRREDDLEEHQVPSVAGASCSPS